jgi:hypothetical protein
LYESSDYVQRTEKQSEQKVSLKNLIIHFGLDYI